MEEQNAMLRKEIDRLNEELAKANGQVEQLRAQLGGVLTAANGATQDVAVRGDWGWSPAYQAVLDLRAEYDKLPVQKIA